MHIENWKNNLLWKNKCSFYSHQLDVLMQSEEKVKALRHDMKNHLGELALMAANQNNEEIRKYIQDMGGVYAEPV